MIGSTLFEDLDMYTGRIEAGQITYYVDHNAQGPSVGACRVVKTGHHGSIEAEPIEGMSGISHVKSIGGLSVRGVFTEHEVRMAALEAGFSDSEAVATPIEAMLDDSEFRIELARELHRAAAIRCGSNVWMHDI